MSNRTLRSWAGLQPPSSIDPTKTALLLIDFQGEYYAADKLLVPDGVAAAANAARLMDAAEARGVKVVHVRHVAAHPKSALFAPDSAGGAIIDAVKPRPGQHVVGKGMISSFVKTDLDATLKDAGIETVIVTGLATHMCVDHTTRDAVSNGYRAIVVADACATRDLPGPDGSTVAHADLHRATLAALADRFADVMTTDAVIGLLTH